MSYMIIGETGESKQINSMAEFKINYNKYFTSLELTPKDVYLVSNRPYEFSSFDQITFAPDSLYFIYTKQYNGETMKQFDQSISKLLASFSLNVSINLNSIPDMTKYVPCLEQNAKFLKGITPSEIRAICTGMIDFYDSFKLIVTKMHLNCKQCDKYKECYQNQCNGIEVIYKQIGSLFDVFISKRKEIEINYNKMKEKTENTLKTYHDSIDKLKTIELHPSIQTSTQKYLIDIYYEEDKMNDWRDKCIMKFKNFTDSIQSKDMIFTQEKNKVRNEKNTSIPQLKNEFSLIVSEYDKLKREKSSKPMNILSELGNEFNKFKGSLSTIIEIFNSNLYNANPNYVSTVDEAIEYIKSLKPKYSNLTISSLQNYLEPFNEICSRMRKVMEASAIKVNAICNSLLRIKTATIELTEKISSYLKTIATVEKDFNFLEMPLFFIHAYKESLGEIKRRLLFNRKIQKDCDRLKAYVFQETIYRKQFIMDYESKVPKDYFQQFLFYDIVLNIEFKNGNETQTLPNILTHDDIINHNTGFLIYPDDQFQYQGQSQSQNQCHSQQNTDQYSLCNLDNNINPVPNSNINPNFNSTQERTDFELLKSFSARIQELEVLLKLKDAELKKAQSKSEMMDKKKLALQIEVNSIQANYDNLTDNFSTQLALKEQRIEKVKKENESLRKYIASSIPNNKMDSCPMCKEAILNSKEYQQVSEIVKEYQDKIMNKNKQCAKIEKSFNDLLTQTNLIKKTFFVHMNDSIEKKNKETASLKTSYESKCMYMEDLLSLEKQTAINHLNSVLQSEDAKMKELTRVAMELENDNKKLRTEREIILKKMEDAKQKESSIQKDLLLVQSQYETKIKEMKALEAQYDSSKRKAKQMANDVLQYSRDLQKIKGDYEMKSKECEEFTKALEKTKEDHISTMNEVHKINQANIDILSKKIEELTIGNTQKSQSQKDSYKRITQTEESLNKTNDENNKLKQKVLELTDKLSTLQSESLTIKEILNEKEKKISELEATITYKNTHRDTQMQMNMNMITSSKDNNMNNTNANETNTITFNNSEFLLSSNQTQLNSNDYISFKKMEKGIQCIFVPHSDGIYVCINLSQNINSYNDEDRNKFFKCQFILNLESFDEELRELIIDNSLIVIGKASKLTQFIPTENDNPYNLPEDSCYTLVTLDHPEYVLGFPGEEMVFRNYVSFS